MEVISVEVVFVEGASTRLLCGRSMIVRWFRVAWKTSMAYPKANARAARRLDVRAHGLVFGEGRAKFFFESVKRTELSRRRRWPRALNVGVVFVGVEPRERGLESTLLLLVERIDVFAFPFVI